MKTIEELNLGFSDAQNYTQRANKDLFNSIFVKNIFLDKLLLPTTYFLIGEKGTGKTAYSVFLQNNEYNDNRTLLKFINGTDYEKFYRLKAAKHLEISDYVSIWKVIIFLLLGKTVTENERFIARFSKQNIHLVMRAIDEYYQNAFTPEIITALKIVDSTGLAAKLISKHIEVDGKDELSLEFEETRFQMNLFYIETQFIKAIDKLKLTKNVNLFIDGIDIRPSDIPYSNYIECIRGLALACWQLNTEVFQNVKDTKGRFKVVLLLRPDIFSALNLQNATNKLRDNAVFLDWRTTYTEYKNSKLYSVSKKILAYQQEDYEDIWEKYFPWKLESTKEDRSYDTAFMDFLRISLSRPRDILIILQLIKEQMLDRNLGSSTIFLEDVYKSDQFQNSYSEYFMGSLKDQLSFYYSENDYSNFVRFFDYFPVSDFDYDLYLRNYNKHTEYILENSEEIPEFVDEPAKFLQLLYDCNIITAIELQENGKPYYHFSYREKNISNIAPKVPIGENITYRFHYGLYKRASFGRF